MIPTIPSLQEPQRTEVRAAFAQATQLIWRVMAGISGAGLLTCLLMQEVELRKDSLDEKWGLKQDEEGERADGEGGEKKTAAASDVEVPVVEG